MRYLHTMVRVSNLEQSLKFFDRLGLSGEGRCRRRKIGARADA